MLDISILHSVNCEESLLLYEAKRMQSLRNPRWIYGYLTVDFMKQGE